MVDRRGRQVPVHRLRANHSVWSPPCVVFFDTETSWVEAPDRAELHRLRLWVGCRVDRRRPEGKLREVKWGWGEDPGSFGDWLSNMTTGRECVWAFAHNLNFDAVTTSLPETMADAGWRVKDFSTGAGSPFFRFGKGKKTLTVCDSWSWLPESLASLSARMGGHKVDLPDNLAATDEWFRRCAVDVDLTGRAVLALMAWWDEQKLGRWTISGPGCGWNAMRHRAPVDNIVVDPDPEAIAFDRLAVRGGRKDSAVIRSATGGPWVELDLVAAYPTVAAHLPLPCKRSKGFAWLPVDHRYLYSEHLGAVAWAHIRTDEPRYPVKHRGVTWYPVGEFRTVLAGPELAYARDRGDLLAVGSGQFHRLRRVLRSWADWVLDPSMGGTVAVPPVGMVATRAWGRSALGKWAARSSTADELTGPVLDGWSHRRLFDARVGRPGADVRMGGRRWLVTFDGDTENCYPAIYAWVESEVRVRLTRVLEATAGNWWSADTDGLILDLSNWQRWWRSGTVRLGNLPRDPMGAAQALCDHLAPLVAPLRLRPKRVFDSLRVLGPQHLDAGGERRLSGVARSATETEPGRFVGRDWPRLAWQLNRSEPGVYKRPERTSTFRSPTVHRWVVDDGSTRPVEFRLGAGGANELVAWPGGRWDDGATRLADLQYRLLTGV